MGVEVKDKITSPLNGGSNPAEMFLEEESKKLLDQIPKCETPSCEKNPKTGSFLSLKSIQPFSDKQDKAQMDKQWHSLEANIFDESDCLLSKEIKELAQTIRVKDSGYAWIVLMALLSSNVLTAGYMKSFGMTYNSILEKFPDTSGSMAGIMMGLLTGFRCIFAPIAGIISNMFGIRNAMSLGTLICCTGLILSFFCSAVWQLSITLGAMIGAGFCLIETSQVVIISDYFEAKLATANGIRVSGNPLGGILYPIILVLLLEAYGATLMRLVLAGITLNILVCAALMRPIHVHQRIRVLEEMSTNLGSKVNDEQKRNIYRTLMSTFCDSRPRNKKSLETKYLNNPTYLIFILMVIFVSLPLPLVIYYLPIYGRSIGLTTVENSILLSTQSAFDLTFRLFIGWMNDKKLYKKLHGFIFCLVLGGIGILLIPTSQSFWGILCFTIVFTIGSASYFVFINVILSEQFGRNSIASTWGFVRMVQGICGFIFPPVLGYIADSTGGYAIPFLVLGGGMVMSGLVLLAEPLVIRITKSGVIIT